MISSEAIAMSLDREKTFLSFLDLGAGMMDIAEEAEKGDAYDWECVSVVPTSEDVKRSADASITLMKGLIWHFLPWLYWIGSRTMEIGYPAVSHRQRFILAYLCCE
jgi:hypothetical protein